MTDRYAVIGNPIAHSKSPQIHKMFAEQSAQDISYEAVLAPLDGFAAKIDGLRKAGYKGCNVTVPFKFEAFEIARQHLTDRASSANAVNTLKFESEKIFGDNTDGAGLVRDITQNHGVLLSARRVLLMGAGGAAYGVVSPLLEAGVILTVVNRTTSKAQQLHQDFSAQGSINVARYEELSGQRFDLVINATSSGLGNDDSPVLPESLFSANAMAYDMMYGRETPFMRFSRKHGAAVVSDGLGMLVEQAAESFWWWHGVRPETASVITALRKPQ